MSDIVGKERVGNITITAFREEKDGKSYVSYSVQKSYKDKEDKWVNKSLSLTDSEFRSLLACVIKSIRG